MTLQKEEWEQLTREDTWAVFTTYLKDRIQREKDLWAGSAYVFTVEGNSQAIGRIQAWEHILTDEFFLDMKDFNDAK